jgi:phosphate:Na+ symporter
MLEEDKKELISRVDELEEEIDKLRSNMIKEHIKRLEDGLCKPSNSGTYINLVSNLERAGDHLSYVAHSIVEEKTGHY